MALNFDQVEFGSNPEPRCPCVLLLDTSGSMEGTPINELNAGLQEFKAALSKDDLALLRVEISIITFGPVQVMQDFITADQFYPPLLSASGNTPMGEAINLALDNIDQRKLTYKQNGISYYRPWIFLITDGAPTDGEIWRSAAHRIKQAEAAKKVAFFSVGVENADFQVLNQLSARQPLKLKGMNFRNMFVWLSSSLSSVSRSKPGEEVTLQSPMGWGKV